MGKLESRPQAWPEPAGLILGDDRRALVPQQTGY